MKFKKLLFVFLLLGCVVCCDDGADKESNRRESGATFVKPNEVIGASQLPQDPKKLFSILAQVDAQLFLKQLNGDISSSENLWLLESLIAINPSVGISAAAERNQIAVIEGMLLRLTGSDPELALELTDKISESGTRKRLKELIFSKLAESDPVKALSLFRESEISGSRRVLATIYREWARSDPEAAARSARELENTSMRKNALRTTIESWARSSPADFLEWIRSGELKPWEKRMAHDSGLAVIAGLEPDRAIAYCDSLDRFEKNRLLPNVLERASQSDPKRVIEWLQSDGNRFVQKEVIESSSKALAVADPRSIIELSVNDAILRQHGLTDAIERLAEDDIASSLVEIEKWRDDEIYYSLLRSVAKAYGRIDLGAAFEWANGISSEFKSHALAALTKSALEQGPERVLTLLDEAGVGYDDLAYSELFRSLARKSASVDVERTAEWVNELPVAIQEHVAKDVARKWTAIDPGPASEWISNLPHGKTRDASIAELVDGIKREDPRMALAWAMAISDTDAREIKVKNTMMNWIVDDYETAIGHMETLDLADELKADIKKSVPKVILENYHGVKP